MAVSNKATLITLMTAKIISGGRQTTAQYVRDLATDMINSYLNVVDGGMVVQAEAGYSSLVTLTDPKAFAYKKWVEDNFASITTVPTFTQVLNAGNSTSGKDINVTAGDKLKIGTGVAAYSLDVFSTARIDKLLLGNPSSAISGYLVSEGRITITGNEDPSVGQDLMLGYYQTGAYKWVQAYSGPLVLNPVGNNVGIFQTNPDAKLHVYSGGILNTTKIFQLGSLAKTDIMTVFEDGQIRLEAGGPSILLRPTNNSTEFYTNSLIRGKVISGGQWFFGNTFPGAAVNATMGVIGTGTTSSTYSFAVYDSAFTSYFKLRDDNRIVYTDGNQGTGKFLQSDSNGVATWSAVLSNTLTMSADPTVALGICTKQYAESLVVGLWDDRGTYDASGNAFPSSGGSGTAGAILKGDIWTISVAGTLGGSAVVAGDTVRALVDSPGTTASNWAIAETNLGYTPITNVLNSAQILVGNASNVASAVTMSGDVTIDNAGVTTIGPLKVTNAMLAGSIAYSKLSLTGSIVNADISGSAAIAYSKLSLTSSIVNGDMALTWTNYGSSLAATGYSGSVTYLNSRYVKVGKVCILQVFFTGTSNANTCTITLPFAAANNVGENQVSVLAIDNNGTKSTSNGFTTANSVTMTIQGSMLTSNSWATSGTKTVCGVIIYETV
ncbi:MAG: hypothetical protein K0S44_230 [Bacteroidetes bacterium]|jgi:hypothetical protein|nr:hypothetical protein [Bacteroidota bacterium]